jgi:hypothetical protein
MLNLTVRYLASYFRVVSSSINIYFLLLNSQFAVDIYINMLMLALCCLAYICMLFEISV